MLALAFLNITYLLLFINFFFYSLTNLLLFIDLLLLIN